MEQIYQIVDTRYRSGKHMIVTTNLTLDELQTPEDRSHARIYDRILERCVPLYMYNIFKAKFPYNSYANVNNGRGYFAAYAAQLGYASCLFEFPDGLYSLSQFQNSGYSADFNSCIVSLMKSYGTYTPYVPEPEPEPVDPHLASCPSVQFTDLSTTAWYHTAVDYCLSEGLFHGTSSTTFEPDLALTRGMIVTLLYRMAGEPEAASVEGTFLDVSGSEWYGKAIAWAKDNGIAKGYPDGNFGPNDVVTRQDMVVFLYRYAQWAGEDTSNGASLSTFADSDRISGYARDAVAWSVAQDIIHGYTSDGSKVFAPLDSATRAQTATILKNYKVGYNTVDSTTVQEETPEEPVETMEMEPNIEADEDDLEGN